MRSPQFRRIVRAVALTFLAWTAVDLGVPTLCALDNELPQAYTSAPTIHTPSNEGGTPSRPVHIDDCFCCSHCVNVTALAAPAGLALAIQAPPLPAEFLPVALGYPPYHPPRT